jgi:hypothetical protein
MLPGKAGCHGGMDCGGRRKRGLTARTGWGLKATTCAPHAGPGLLRAEASAAEGEEPALESCGEP